MMMREQLLEQLLQLLSRLLRDGDLDDAQVEAIFHYWRNQPMPALARVLPLALEQGVGPLQEDDDNDPALFFWLGVGGGAAVYRRARIDAANKVQDEHAAMSAQLADDFAAGRISLADWQEAQRRLNAGALAAMASLGNPRGTVQLQQRLAAIEQEQAAYLQRFADQLSARQLAALMPGDDDTRRGGLLLLLEWGGGYIARRAASYSGAARGVFFEAMESSGTGTNGAGWVVRYEARDDDRTCSRCLDAQGYYLPGHGPMPGEVCYGGGACRCERMSVYDPAMYAQLIGSGL